MKQFVLFIYLLSLSLSAQPTTYYSCAISDENEAEFDIDAILQDYAGYVPENVVTEEVYISINNEGIYKVVNPSDNPQLEEVCREVPGVSFFYEVAINSNGEIFFNNYMNELFKLNTNTCTAQKVGDIKGPVALSFDNQDNLYSGGFGTEVYRYNAGQFVVDNVWHDFGDRQPAGDFVMLGDYMYVAWREASGYYLYKVTLDADNQYVSHENLGAIKDRTYGLASENGKFYGITPSELYEINLETLATRTVITNPQSGGEWRWYGAAGLHEAITYSIAAYQDAGLLQPLRGIFTTGSTVIYLVVRDSDGNEVERININLEVVQPPQIEEVTYNGTTHSIRVEVAGDATDLLYSIDNVNWQTSPEFSYQRGETVRVYVKNSNACGVATQDFFLEELPTPKLEELILPTNFISPNGDGKNDVFKIENLEKFEGIEIYIYNRYGKLLKSQIGGSAFEWDGKYMNRLLPSTDYYYLIIYNDKTQAGHITLRHK